MINKVFRDFSVEWEIFPEGRFFGLAIYDSGILFKGENNGFRKV